MVKVWQQAVAEIVGTFALVFIGAGSVVVLGGGGADALLAIALAHGLVIAVMVSAVGHLSGGHFNPAVTVGAWVAGKIETARALVYLVAQLLGGAGGALLLKYALPSTFTERNALGTPLVNHELGVETGQAILIEGVLAFFLVFVVFAVAVDDRGSFPKVAGLPIGFVITFDILMGGAFTGAAMNPARSFGPALVSMTWTDWWVYWIGPVAGGVVAAVLYWFAFLRDRVIVEPREEQPIGGGPENV